MLTQLSALDLPIADVFDLTCLQDLDPFGEDTTPGLVLPWSVADPWEPRRGRDLQLRHLRLVGGSLSESDIRPVAGHVLKVASRCDLACHHCFVYDDLQQSWLRQPSRMDLVFAHLVAIASRSTPSASRRRAFFGRASTTSFS